MITMNLRDVVDSKGLTMTEVHKNTGISKNTLSTMANGLNKGIQFDTLDKLLEFLEVEVEDLILFTSQKEIDLFSVDIVDKGIVDVEENTKGDTIFEPHPSKEEGESQLEYEARTEKVVVKPIGQTNDLRVIKEYKISIDYDDFQYTFNQKFLFFSSTINDLNNVKVQFEKSEHYEGVKFEDEQMWWYVNFFVTTNNLNNEKSLADHLNRIQLKQVQLEIVYDKVKDALLNTIPDEIKEKMEEYVVNPNEIKVHID